MTSPPNVCATCGHVWSYHTDAESLEDEALGDTEPCMYPGCACRDFTVSNPVQPTDTLDA